MQKKTLIIIFALFGYLLVYPRIAIESARSGLLLWYHSVLPVVFPFMFLGTLVIHIVGAKDLPKQFTRPFCRIFSCSSYGAFVIAAGFICGLPMGAKLTGDLYREHKISRREALYLLSFSNNVSPGFVLSYLASDQMHLPEHGFLFLLQILGAALINGWLNARSRTKTEDLHEESLTIPSSADTHSHVSFSLIDDCIYDSISSALRLGGYILLFAILTGAVSQAIPAESPAELALLSCIEITNGIHLIAVSSLPDTVKYIAVSAVAAFGGLSALAQSAGIARMDEKMLLYYIKSRVKITLLASLLSVIILLLQSWQSIFK